MAEITNTPISPKLAQRIERVAVGSNGVAALHQHKEALRSVEIADVDLVLRFNDGTNVVIPNGAMEALSDKAPLISFSGKQESSSDLLKSAGKTSIVTAGNVRIVTEELDTHATTSQGGDQQSGNNSATSDADRAVSLPAPVIKPTPVSAVVKSGADGNGSGQDGAIQPVRVDIPTVYKQGIRVTGADNLPIKTPYTEANYYVSDQYKLQPAGTTDVPVGSKTSAANALSDQAAIQVITGTSGDDVITHNTAFTSSTAVWESTLHLDFPNFTTLTAVTLTLSSASAGIFFSSAQATQLSANSWSLVIDSDALNKGIDLQVRYNVAADGSTPNSLITMDVETLGKAGVFSFDLVKTLTFLYTNATTAADFSQTTAAGDPIYTLPAFGVGYKILAGDGNDTVNAGAGPDQIFGQAGNDTLHGEAGNDLLDGGAGADLLDGGTGTNTAAYGDANVGVVASLSAGTFKGVAFTSTPGGIVNGGSASTAGDAGGDTLLNIQNLSGSDYADTLIGDANANVLSGGGGDDTLEGMGGADTLDGGTGSNTASYEHAGSAVVASLSAGNFSGIAFTAGSSGGVVNGGNAGAAGDAGGDTLVNIQNLTGSAYDDVLVGDGAANTLLGGAGDDTLQGMAGADVLDGGTGTNTASYSAASNGVVASLSAGTFGAYTFIDTVVGGVHGITTDPSISVATAGDATGDTLINIQNLTGSAFNDTLIGSSTANSLLEGGGGSDTLIGNGSATTAAYATAETGVVASLSAGTFSNIAFMASGSGIFNAGSSAYAGDAAGDLLVGITDLLGSSHNDTLVGNAGSNTLSGGAGDDILEGMAGSDILDGGSGSNTASYSGASTGVISSLSTGTFGGVSFSAGSGGVGLHNDGLASAAGDAGGDTLINIQNLSGSNFSDFLVGSAGANTLSGGAGDDVLEGMGGGDTLDGGSGSNTVTYEDATAGVISSLGAGTYYGLNFVSAGGGVRNDGGTAAGIAAGETLINIQNIRGSSFNDILVGDSGNNVLEGGAGADVLNGNGGNDTASYAHSGSAVTVSLTSGTGSGGDAAGDTLVNIQNLTGSAYADTLIGDGNANVLSGGDGDDMLQGMGGADVLDGGNGNNTASYASSGAAVTVSLTTGTGSGGDATGDTLTHIQNLTGSAYADTLIGDGNANVLSGGDGDDILQGMGGADVLDGGNGNNTASYASSGAAVTVSLTTGTGSGGDAAGDTLTHIQNLTGSAYADTLIGDGNANVLSGGDGDDMLQGMGGADVLDGGNGNNTASYAASGTGVTVSLTTGTGSGGDAAGDTLINIQNLTGSAYADTLIGDSNANVLSGGDGDDILQGMGGADVLDGGNGNNTASYANAGSAVVASLSAGSFGGVTFNATSGGIVNTSTASDDAAGDTLTHIQNLTGSAYADTLIGDGNANVLSGGDGDDMLQGMGGADVLDGGNGNNTASYAASGAAVTVSLTTGTGSGGDATGDTLNHIQNLTGSAYADTLIGDANANVLSGGAGDDILQGMGGADVLDGGGGINTASYAASGTGVTVSLTTGTGSGGDAAGDTLVNIQNLTGSAYADTLIGDGNANVLSGGDGDDMLQGMGGADVLDGGNGNNTASYASSGAAVTVSLTTGTGSGGDATGDTLTHIQNLTGSAYADTLIGDGNANVLSGGDGDDILQGMGGADTLDGGNGTNTASYDTAASAVAVSLASGTGTLGDAAGDTLTNIQNLIGSAYNDTLTGDSKSNLIIGGAGADTIDGGADVDTVSYATASAAITASLTAGTYNGVLFSNSGGGVSNGSGSGDAAGDVLINIENLTGSAQNDFLVGSSGVNVLSGGDGDDTLMGLAGADTLNGGNGNNTASYATGGAGVVASLTAGVFGGVTFSVNNGGIQNTSNASNDAAGDTLINIQNLTGTGYADTLIGDANANVLSGGAGDDVLQGMGGADVLDGGSGTNTASYANAASGVAVSLATGTGTLGDAAGDTLTNIQNLIGSAYADTLIGDGNANVITGGAGNDTISAGGGNDIIDGGAGADTIDGGNGTDTISYASAGTRVIASLSTGTYSSVTFDSIAAGIRNNGNSTSAGDAGGDVLTGIENMVGSAYADTLVGDANDNVLEGGAGGDTLNGLGGTDTATYANAGGIVVASLSVGNFLTTTGVIVSFTASGGGIFNNGNTTNAGQASGDTLVNIENLTGSAYNDTLVGDGNANVLDGGNGNDILQGGGGADTLNGNTGTDTASYANAGSGVVASLSVGTFGSVSFTGSTGNIVNGGSAATAGDAGGDTLISIENLTGSAYNDVLIGDSNNNTLDGGAGADLLNGGGGVDTVTYANSSVGVVASLSVGTFVGTFGSVAFTGSAGNVVNGGDAGTAGDAGGDTLVAIRNLIGSSNNDILVGDANANTIAGGAGNDTIQGMAGADAMDGGAGNDTASYENAGSAVAVSLTTGTGTLGDANGDTLSNFENLTGSTYDDTLTGDANVNILVGGAGNDTLQGMAGGDTIDGGAGSDTASYASAGSAVIASLSTGTFGGVFFSSSGSGVLNTGGSTLAGDAGGDTLIGIENLTGSAYNDVLVGDGNANVLTGGNGNDTLQGMAGGDTLDGGSGTDTASYANASAGVIASLVAGTYGGVTFTSSGSGILNGDTTTASGDAQGDLLISIENLIGSAYADTLVASTGSAIQGLAGDDTIYVSNSAGALPGTVDGGTGNDTVVVSGMTTGSVSMSGLANLLSNVETLNIRDGINSTTSFSVADIQHIVNNGASSSLTILANTGDVFSFSSVAGQTMATTDLSNGNYNYTISSGGSTVATVHWQVT